MSIDEQKEPFHRLRSFREEQNMTVVELAKRLKISRSMVYAIESGARGISIPVSLKLAKMTKRKVTARAWRHPERYKNRYHNGGSLRDGE